MTRQEEIKILQSLKGDSYFAQFFGEDIDKMCENIGNDFPIEMGCKFNEKSEETKALMRKERDNAKEWKKELADYLIKTNDLQGTAVQLAGMLEVIKIKRKHDIPLLEDEIDELISRASE